MTVIFIGLVVMANLANHIQDWNTFFGKTGQ